MPLDQSMLDEVASIAQRAGREVQRIYEDERVSVEKKGDGTPLTNADRAAHRMICEELERLGTGWPILSEESDDGAHQDWVAWDCFWLIDPIDGTKEFIDRTGDFTVNIALVHEGEAVLGVIHVPVRDQLVVAAEGDGWVLQGDRRTALEKTKRPTDTLTMLVSRRHQGRLPSFAPVGEEFAQKLQTQTMGSSLKYASMAMGQGHFHLRKGPTMIWDTAAGQVILEAVGGAILDLHGNKLTYEGPNLRNPAFLAVSHRDYPWKPLMEWATKVDISRR